MNLDDLVSLKISLAEIEDVDYRAEFDHARSTLNNAQERLAQLKKELPEEIKKAQAAGDPDTGETYYQHWLATLERIIQGRLKNNQY